jgi:hypothetical protein
MSDSIDPEPADSEGPASEERQARLVVISEHAKSAEFVADVESILGKSLSLPAVGERVRDAIARLGDYFDNEGAAIGLITALSSDPEYRGDLENDLPELASEHRERLEPVFRRLRALYSSELTESMNAFGNDPENWASLLLTATINPSDGTWRVEFDVSRFDGSTARFAGPPGSFIKLANYILNQLLATPQLPASELGDQLDLLLKTADGFRSAFAEVSPAAAPAAVTS